MEPPDQSLTPERVVQELAAPVRRFLGRCVGDSPVADDLAQETLIRARVAADHFRNPVNRVQIVDVDESGKLPDEERAIDQRLVVDEMNTCVRPVIDTLPEDYRLALVLHDLEGLTAAQTAEVCGCSVPTAKIRIHRARLRLREALQTGCDFYRDGDDVLRAGAGGTTSAMGDFGVQGVATLRPQRSLRALAAWLRAASA